MNGRRGLCARYRSRSSSSRSRSSSRVSARGSSGDDGHRGDGIRDGDGAEPCRRAGRRSGSTSRRVDGHLSLASHRCTRGTDRWDSSTARLRLVTGAGRGIGRSEALLLASEGAKVVVNDLGGSGAGEGADQTPAQQVVDEIEAAGGEAVANYDDCSSWAGAEAHGAAGHRHLRRARRAHLQRRHPARQDELQHVARRSWTRSSASTSRATSRRSASRRRTGGPRPRRRASPPTRRSSTPRRSRASTATPARPTTRRRRPASRR